MAKQNPVSNFFNSAELRQIEEAVAAAELKTAGEIKVVIVGKCEKNSPEQTVEDAVHERLLKEFAALGISDTRDDTGIMIMLSVEDRRVEIWGDTAIHELVGQDAWGTARDMIINGIKAHTHGAGICDAVKFVGDLLALHFPRKDDDKNELSDEVVIKED